MSTEVEQQQQYTLIPLDRIVSKLNVRRLSTQGLKRIKKSMEQYGFLNDHPIIVSPEEGSMYKLIEGNHRYVDALDLGISPIPCIVEIGLSEEEQYRRAVMSNNASEAMVPPTMVTNAEFVWARAKEGYTLQQIGENMLGWNEDKVKHYSALSAIATEAWDVIVTTFDSSSNSEEDGDVTSKVTGVTFTEFMLRDILNIEPVQQLELVTALATDKNFSKGKFKERAENYQARNAMYKYANQQLGDLGDEYSNKLKEKVYSGAYDDDWKKTENHPKLRGLLTSYKDEWEQKHNVHLIYGDFYEEVKKIGNGSIDLILTDPPYNVANKREFSLNGRKNISQNFGEWDKYEHVDFISLFDAWGNEWFRVLREGGSGYVFTSYVYVSHLLEALERAGLIVKNVIVWHKTNPGTQVEKTSYRTSTEHIIFFTKKGQGYTFNWQGENEMHDHIQASICQGNERRVDERGDTLHPTQKPLAVLKHLLEVSSNRGDVVFDGFAGVGSSGMAAKQLARKFIGIEKEKKFFAVMQDWLSDDKKPT